MINALTYQEMLDKIKENILEKRIEDNYAGILFTRPDLDTGKEILKSLEYYHHLTGKSVNFYLPGYGAYWYGAYPDGKVVAEIDGVQWSFSNKEFVKFVEDIEKNSKWEYSGESELLLVNIEKGEPSYEVILQFHLDNMLRDNAICSVPAFFQELSRLLKNKQNLIEVSDSLGVDKAIEILKDGFLKSIPYKMGDVVTQEKYFCIRNMKK